MSEHNRDLEVALQEFHMALLKDPVALWRDLSPYRGNETIDAHLVLLGPIVEAWLEHQQLTIYRIAHGKRGRPLKAWPDFLLERLAVERVKAQRNKIKREKPSINSLDALDAAIEAVSKNSKPHVATSTLREWVDHPTRLHRRRRPRR